MRVASRLIVVIAFAAAAVVAYTPPAASAVPAWSIVPSASPAGAPSGFLSGVACASAVNCFAVGDFQSGESGGAVLEHFDGATWSLVSLPIPDTGAGTFGSAALSDVACPGATTCFAVGTNSVEKQSQALIERWDGTTWSIVPLSGAALMFDPTSIACSSETQCFAVGVGSSTQIDEWNGATWTAVASPTAPGGNTLVGVSCRVDDLLRSRLRLRQLPERVAHRGVERHGLVGRDEPDPGRIVVPRIPSGVVRDLHVVPRHR